MPCLGGRGTGNNRNRTAAGNGPGRPAAIARGENSDRRLNAPAGRNSGPGIFPARLTEKAILPAGHGRPLTPRPTNQSAAPPGQDAGRPSVEDFPR